MWPGDHDVERAVNELAQVLPEPLRPLARVAYDYRWSWSKGGAGMFEAIDPPRWARTGHNPRRLLTETHPLMLASASAKSGFVGWASRIAAELAAGPGPPGCLLLLGVWCAWIAAHLFRRPGHSGRRHSQRSDCPVFG